MKKIVTLMLFFLLTAVFLQADVIRLKSGVIYIGRVISLDEGGVKIEAFGDTRTIPYADLARTEKDMNALKDQAVSMTLKDGTVIRGKIKNYDEDIGFLVEIDFGTITVPLENVTAIVDMNQERSYVARFTQIGVSGGAFFAVGDLGATYAANVAATVFQEFNLGFIFEGLFAGYSLSYYNLTCATSDSYSYLFFNAGASIIYRMVFIRRSSSFIRNFVPFIGAGAGAAVPVMTYYGTTGAEVDLSISGAVGFDVFLNDDFFIRVDGRWLSVAQNTIWFNSVAVGFGVAFSF
ncbi:MAG: hypothetical protein JXD23_06305 [Spirochaetales bacterium]|nr:hypothetical protein [Spirochaetales bacterium]